MYLEYVHGLKETKLRAKEMVGKSHPKWKPSHWVLVYWHKKSWFLRPCALTKILPRPHAVLPFLSFCSELPIFLFLYRITKPQSSWVMSLLHWKFSFILPHFHLAAPKQFSTVGPVSFPPTGSCTWWLHRL